MVPRNKESKIHASRQVGRRAWLICVVRQTEVLDVGLIIKANVRFRFLVITTYSEYIVLYVPVIKGTR
jgi:hypothetical protein